MLATTFAKGDRLEPAASPKKKTHRLLVGDVSAAPSTKSQRSVVDEGAPLGVATTRSMERVAAAVGLLQEAPIEFEPVADVPLGGVLWALPALLAVGLLRHRRKLFTLPAGFYPIETIFLVVAFLALVRIRSLEALRYEPPGEWGKLVGLDRVPEVSTLREKLGLLCAEPERPRAWSSTLAREWMEATPASAGTLYIDGHVRVYHGTLTRLPRRYVSRERLCLRGTTDYWINALDGRPFFWSVVRSMPGYRGPARDRPPAPDRGARPTQRRRTGGRSITPSLHPRVRSRGLFAKVLRRQRAQRVAVITYHKFPGADWRLEEFS